MKLSEMPKNDSNSKVNESKNKTVEQTYEELKGQSSDQLMARLAKEIQMQKQSGVFDYEGLRSSIEKIKTYLPAQTYENMINIIDGLK